jgi:hypothetical protein
MSRVLIAGRSTRIYARGMNRILCALFVLVLALTGAQAASL